MRSWFGRNSGEIKRVATGLAVFAVLASLVVAYSTAIQDAATRHPTLLVILGAITVCAMTTATYDKQVAAAARRAAIAGTALAQEQLDDLVERRARARATVKALRAEDADAAEERGEVTASVKKLEARLATIQKRVAEVERSLAGVEAPPKKKREEEAS